VEGLKAMERSKQNHLNFPVFTFENGKFLNLEVLTNTVKLLLHPHKGSNVDSIAGPQAFQQHFLIALIMHQMTRLNGGALEQQQLLSIHSFETPCLPRKIQEDQISILNTGL
jgi:hypothetical protein